MEMESGDDIVNVDGNHNDPQLCATIACDIFKYLRMAEVILGYKVRRMLLRVTTYYYPPSSSNHLSHPLSHL